ncbi:MAG TPA: hypothetical protein PK323_08465, partial [Bacteroidia bacterium]|nr:hypothetical protein [Bacteroidia bacterium]
KAGFFKAKYNNWIVADFRPERSPLRNLTASICKQLKITDEVKTEKELGYGFSALCDLYKASSFYIDESKSEWQQADEKGRKAQKRKAANLLVLVDQFEEFFTNPENYQNGIPSIESQKTINLLLETYKIAAAQELPIYIICTMRSDYIGQCAAFRGLPEAIGYSQFFVPRLKRQEIEQVIEGPAELAGCKISKRLTQTLLNSLTDGFDQLPILQHALHQVWKAADFGNEVLDVIHLAKVGGLSAKMLTIQDKQQFENWFNSIPAYKKELLEKPSLSNVLNAHANELFFTAHSIYKEKFGKSIDADVAQKIIKTVFQCLTKVDASRAVRNRMTLQEITEIINDKNITTSIVDQLLFVYREQGNTFIQPFVDAEQGYEPLAPDKVLDITHESLIRNWTKCTQWANEENDNVQTYFDFDKQLNRWINSKYNSGYLLPIGPLTYFEQWYENLKPSQYWINRYEKFNGSEDGSLKAAEVKLNEVQSFLNKSAKRLFVTKTILKYGANRLGIIAGVILLISLCTYYYFDYRKKQNDYVLNELLLSGKEMLKSKNVTVEAKAEFLINNDRINLLNGNNIEFEQLLDKLENDTLAFDIGYAMIDICVARIDSTTFDKKGEYTFKLFEYLYTNFEKDISNKTNKISKKQFVKLSKYGANRLNDFLGICAKIKLNGSLTYKNSVDTIIDKVIFKTQWYLSEAIKSNYYQKKLVEQDVLYTIATMIAIDDNPNFSELIHLLSPIESDVEARVRFDSIFKSNTTYEFNCGALPKQGGFHLLALLYATQFKSDITAKSKIEALIDSNQFYKRNYLPLDIYLTLYRNFSNDKSDFDFVLENYSQNEYEMAQFVGLSVQQLFLRLNTKENFPSSFITCFIPKIGAMSLLDRGEKILLKATPSDSTKMNLAVFYKKRGFYYSNYLNKINEAEMYFKAGLNYFKSVSFEHQNLNHYFDKINWSNAFLPNYKWFLSGFLHNEYEIFEYNCSRTMIGLQILPGKSSFSPFIDFLTHENYEGYISSPKYMEVFTDFSAFGEDDQTNAVLRILNDYYKKNKSIILSDPNGLKIKLNMAYHLLKENKIKEANKELDSVFKMNNKDYDASYSWIEANAILLAQKSDTMRCVKLLNFVKDIERKKNILLKICYQLQDGEGVENTFFFLNELLKNYSNDSKMGMALYRVLGKIGGYEAERYQAKKKYRNTPELLKPMAINNWVLGTAENGNYYKAKKLIPESVSETKELILINQIIKTEVVRLSNKNKTNAWKGEWNETNYFNLDFQYEFQSNDYKINSLE